MLARAVGLGRGRRRISDVHQIMAPGAGERGRPARGERPGIGPVVPPIGRPDPVGDLPGGEVHGEQDEMVARLAPTDRSPAPPPGPPRRSEGGRNRSSGVAADRRPARSAASATAGCRRPRRPPRPRPRSASARSAWTTAQTVFTAIASRGKGAISRSASGVAAPKPALIASSRARLNSRSRADMAVGRVVEQDAATAGRARRLQQRDPRRLGNVDPPERPRPARVGCCRRCA